MAQANYTQVFEIEEPETGKRYRVEGVEGTTREEAIQYLSSLPEEEIAKREVLRPNAMLGANAQQGVMTRELKDFPEGRNFLRDQFFNRKQFGEVQSEFNKRYGALGIKLPDYLPNMVSQAGVWAKNQALLDTPAGRQYFQNNDPIAPVQKATGVEDPLAPDSVLEEFGVSAQRGLANMANTVTGAGALVADLVGADEIAQRLADDYLETQAAIGLNYPTSAGQAVDIRSFDDFGRWAASVVGELGPQLTASLGGGVIGGLAARKIIERKAADFVEKRVAEGGIREVAEAEVARQIEKATLKGGIAGAGAVSEVQSVGSVYGDTYGATGELAPWTSLLAGTAVAALDTIIPARILSKVGGPAANDIVAEGLVKRLGKEGAAQFLLEGGTEALQTVIEQLPAGQPIDWDQVLEAGLRGGFGGSVTGAGTAGFEASRQTPSKLPAQPRTAVPEGVEPISVPEAAPKRSAGYKAAIEKTRTGVENRARSLTSSWENAPEIEVHTNFQKLKGVSNSAIGVYSDGKLQLNTENIVKEARRRKVAPDDIVSAVTYHEGLGHHGLLQLFGEELDTKLATILDQSSVYRSRVNAWLKKHPDAYAGDRNRDVRAMEELLAEGSENGQLPASFVNVLKNTVKDFGRRMGIDLEYSTREVQTILGLAHSAVVSGKGRDARSNGFRFMYAGENANTAHLGRLEFAKSLSRAGVDSEKIRKGVGWFKAPDGKWRFEINDSKAESHLGNMMGQSWRLDEVLVHPELFEAYPELKNLRITRDPREFQSEYDLGFIEEGLIGINPVLSEKKAKTTLLHEIQHAIQLMEGFAIGGNSDIAFEFMSDETLVRGAKNFLAYSRKDPSVQGTPEEKEAFLTQFKQLIDGKQYKALRNFFKKDRQAAFQAYQHLFGEVEARDVEIREEMTDGQRREYEPYSMEPDIDPESYIIGTLEEYRDGPRQEATVYHGSPHDFDEFDHSKMGSGEGAQVYGWGTYLTETRSIAQQYRDKLSGGGKYITLTDLWGDETTLSKWASPAEIAAALGLPAEDAARNYPAQYMMNELARGFTLEEAEKTTRQDYSHYQDQEGVEWAINRVKEANPKVDVGSGRVYEVEIPDNAKWINWDERLKNQKQVLKALKKAGFRLTTAEELQAKATKSYDLEKELEALQNLSNRTEAQQERMQRLAKEIAYIETFRATGLSVNMPGQSLLKTLERKIGKPKDVAEFLNKIGFEGVKYLDGFSRNKGEGSHNYVVFNDKTPKIVNKYMMMTNPDKVEFTPEEIEAMTPEELFESENTMKILNQMTEGYEPVIMSFDDLEQEARLRDLRPSTVLRKKGVGAGELVKRLYMYDIAMTKINDKLSGLLEKIQSGQYSADDKINFIATTVKQQELAARIFEDQGEIGRALAAMKTLQYTRRSTVGMQETLQQFGDNSPFAHLNDEEAFLKFAMGISDQIAAGKEKMKEKGKDWAVNALNLPRALMSTLDLSAPLRQGLFLIHKGAWWKSFFNMFRYWSSEQAFKDLREDIMARPTYGEMMRAKLALSDIDGNLTSREEDFQTEWAQKIPGLGRLVRMSERAYSGFLNKLRADVFDQLVAKLPEGYTDKDLQDLGRFINAASGRGNLPKGLQSSAPLLNALLFSPRLIASRVVMTTALVDPRTYTTMNKVARNEYVKSILTVGATATLILSLAAMAGAEVEKDPRSSDFAKIKVGNTRYDILGGEGQYITLASRLYMNSTKTADGAIRPYGNDFGQTTRKDAAYKFFENKAAPVPSFVLDYLRGTNAIGEKFEMDSALVQRFVPMFAMDMYENVRDEGFAKGAAMSAPAAFGVGVQNYKSYSQDAGRELEAPETFAYKTAKDGEYGNATVEDGIVRLDEKAKKEWTRILNTYIREWMKDEMSSPEWKTMTKEERKDAIKAVRDDARKETKKDMLELLQIEEEPE